MPHGLAKQSRGQTVQVRPLDNEPRKDASCFATVALQEVSAKLSLDRLLPMTAKLGILWQ